MADLKKTIQIVVETTTGNAKKGFSDLKSGVADAEGSLGKFKAAASGAGNLLSSLPLPAVAGGLIAAGSAVKALGDKFTGAALQAKKLSETTGLSVETSSEWIAAADDVGLSAETISGAFGKATKALGTNTAAFEEQGVAIAHAKDGTVDMNATLLNAITTIQNIEDPTKKAALASQLFGKSWADLTPILSQSEDQLRSTLKATSEAQRITDDEVKSAQAWQATMDDLGDTIEDLELTLGKFVVDGMGPALETVSEFTGTLDELINELDAGTGGVEKIGEGFAFWLKYLSPVGPAIFLIQKQMELWSKVADNAGTALVALRVATEPIVDAAHTAADAIEEIPGAVEHLIAAVPGAQTAGEGIAKGIDKISKAAEFAFLNFTPPGQLIRAVGVAKAGVDALFGGSDGEGDVKVISSRALAVDGMSKNIDGMTLSLRAAGVETKFEADQAEDAAKAIAHMAGDAKAEADAERDRVSALKEATAALLEQNDTMKSLTDTRFAYNKAARDSQQALSDLDGAVKAINDSDADAATKERELQQLYEDTTQKVIGSAEAQVQLAKDTALASGATFDHTKELDTLNASLLASASATSGPVRESILQHIKDVNGIPDEKVTQIEAAIAAGDLAEAQRLLDEASAARTATIKADADTVQAKLDLDRLSQTRDVTLRVHTDAPQARASGGPVEAGQAYVVGETHRELFIPNVPGRIVPTVPGGQGGGPSINVTVNGGGPGVAKEVINELSWAMRIGRVA